MTPVTTNLANSRRWLRRVAAGLALLLAVAISAWLSFPLWSPLVVSQLLPGGWRLVELDSGRPGLRSLPIEKMVATGEVPGFRIEAAAHGISLRLDGSDIEIDRLIVSLSPSPPAQPRPPESGRDFIDRWSLPRLVPPGGLPRIGIVRLEWSFGSTNKAQAGVLNDLVFGQDASSVTLETALNPIPMMTRPGLLTIHLSGDGAYLDLFSTGENSRRVFFYRQANIGTRQAGRGQGAIATVQFDLDLAELDRDALQPFMAPLAAGSLQRAEGALRAGLQFQGQERLQPLAFSLEADGVDLAAGEESLQLEWAINGGLDGAAIVLEQERLDTGIVVRPERWAQVRQAALSRLGLSGLPTGPAKLTLTAAGPGRGRIDMRRGTPEAWAGDFRLRAEVASSHADLAVTDGRLTTTGTGSPEFEATVSAFLQHPGKLRLDHGSLGMDLDNTELAFQTGFQIHPSGLQTHDGQLTGFTTDTIRLSVDGLELSARNARLSGEFEWDGSGRFQGPLQGADLAVRDPEAALPVLQSASLSGSLEASLADQLIAKGHLRFDGASLPAMDISMDGLDIEIEQLDLASQDGQLSVLTTGMSVPLFEKKTTGFDLDLDSEIKAGGPYRGAGELLIGYSGALPFTFHTSSESGQLVIDLDRSVLSASALPTLLRTLEPAWADPFKPGQGELVLDGSIEFLEVDGDFTPSGVVAIDADDLAFCYGKSCIRDLDLHGAWSLGQELSGATSLGIGQAGLAAGLDLSQFQAQIDVASPRRIELHEFSASLLDGRLQSSPITIENQFMADTTVTWTDFDLARLFTFLDVSGLEGNGRIDAELPIVNTNGQYGISGGRFRADGPGAIRYRTGVPAANIGMRALENFQFASLDGTIDYRPSGRYDIRVTLDGRNPDLYGGHPVRFNLNIGGELPALFKTLFITGDFGEAILDQIRAGQQDLTDPGP